MFLYNKRIDYIKALFQFASAILRLGEQNFTQVALKKIAMGRL